MQPGESTTVTMQFTMTPGMGGPHDFRVDLTTNEPAAVARTLVVKSVWR